MQRIEVNPRLAGKPPYVLLILRDEGIGDWESLCLFFGWEPDLHHTGHSMLRDSLSRLEKAGLISRTENEGKITVSDTLSKIQAAIGISIKDIALREGQDGLIVKPIFGKPSDHHYELDLFVLMPFAAQLQPIYDDHIKLVAQELSLSVARADDFFTSESIMQEVWEAIYYSKILLADCTGRNPNVFYEIGLAHTLGKPVVLITQDENDVPFDLRHRRFIKYEYTPRGMTAFEKQLSAALDAVRRRV